MIGVEELLRAVDRVAEDGRGDAGERRVARHLVAVAAAVHQVRRAGRADLGVVEPLEHRLDVAREVLEVHVVDRVGERLPQPERLRRLEARAVLDVAPLLAVVPVHARDLVLLRAGAGGDRGGAHGRDRREGGHAVVDVLALLEQQLEDRRAAARHRPLEHRGLHGVDDDEDELLAHREDSEARVLLAGAAAPAGEQPGEPGDDEDRERREEHRGAGGGQRRALAVERQHRLGLGVEPAAHADEQRAGGEEAERRRGGPGHDAGGDHVVVVGQRRGALQRAQDQREHQQRVHDRPGVHVRPAAGDELEQHHQHEHGEQERPLLQEREGGALEVDAEVGRGERSHQEHRQERTDADRGGDPGALQEVEHEFHLRRATIAGEWGETRHRSARVRGTSSATRDCSRSARRR